MKTVLKRILVLIVALALLSSCFVACDNNKDNNNDSKPSENPSTPNEQPTDKVVYTLHLSADKTNVGRGDKVILSAVLKAEGEEDIPSEDTEFIIVSGADYAGIIGNVLTIRSNAPDGATIEVQAKEGASTSNTVTITVSVPLNSITISAETTKPVAGQSVTITKVLDPTDATQPISWTITEGSDIATMDGDKLVVSENASVGDVIKLKATFENVESNELVLTVKSATDEIKATKVTISAEKYNLFENTSVILSAVTEPAIITDDVVFYIVEGEDYAEIIGNVLKVKANAPVGTTIKVEASAGDTISINELSFKVIQEPKPAQSITIDALNRTPLAGQTVTIDYKINPSDTTDVMSWVIVEGGDYAEMSGNILVVKDTAPDNAVIKVKATAGEVESEVLEFTVKPKHVDVEIKAENIVISADKNTVLRGDEIAIEVNVLPENHTDEVRLVITQGADHATLVGKTLVVDNEAPDGTVIKVKAIGDEAGSNELTFTVKVEVVTKPAQSVTISTDNLNPIAGSRVEINCVVDPADTTDIVSWAIVEGGDYASMSGHFLVINSDAPDNAVIKVQATAGDVTSEVLEFTVKPVHEEILIESIQISAEGGVENLLAGASLNIITNITPSDATQQISWVLLEGSAKYAKMVGNTLVVNEGVRAGTVIKIKARATNGDTRVDSNVLTFTILPSQDEILSNTFYIELPETITLDKKGTSAIPVLFAEVYNGHYETVEGKEIEFRIIEGAQYLDIDSNNSSCTFLSMKGHGTVVIEARIKGTDVVETATVKVIVPPDSITIPEVFAERTDIEYSFSLLDHEISGATSNIVKEAGASKLPFAFSAVGSELSCKDVAISFTHESGKVGDEVAVYENGCIIFKMTGKVVATVSSVSGSENEASISYTFNINDGYNVNTFEEAWLVIRNASYTGQQINFVVLEKPVGKDCTVAGCYCGGKHYNYGYDLVPLVALKDHKDQHIDLIIRGPRDEVPAMHSNRIQAVNKGLYVNGNNHKIDASQMRLFTEAEYQDYRERYGITDGYMPNLSSLFSAEPWNTGGDVDEGTNNNKTYSVNLYNFEVKGNMPVDYDVNLFRNKGSNSTNVGGFTHGVNIGTREYQCHYYIDADSLTSSGFYSGLSFLGIVGNGTVSNVHAYNCYSTGIFCRSSIMTLENLKFGRCGATGIELAPEECNEAGLNDNEVQHVTIKGTIDAYANVNNGNTNYFKDYNIQGATIPQIIEGNVAAIVSTWEQLTGNKEYGEIAVSHIKNEKGEFIFVGLTFNDLTTLAPNSSKLTYDEGGIIDVADLPKDGSLDHEHQFIRMPVMVTIPGLGTIQAGTAIFYNHNYYVD